jgi:hypothetical protein
VGPVTYMLMVQLDRTWTRVSRSSARFDGLSQDAGIRVYSTTHAVPAVLCLSPQALAAHHSNTPGFRVAYKRRATPLQPPLRPNRVEMRDATFCFCPSGFGARHLTTCLHLELGYSAMLLLHRHALQATLVLSGFVHANDCKAELAASSACKP